MRDISFVEGRFRRATAYVLCLVVAGLTGLAIILNIAEGNEELLLPLSLVVFAACAAFIWLGLKSDATFGPLYLCLCALVMLGVFLLLRQGAPSGSSLYWFLLFPSMAMFCLGLRRGTIVVCAFLFFLLLVLATPLQIFLAEPLSHTVRVRFLIAMLGAVVFSWGAEYTRYQTRNALARTLARLEADSLTDPLTGLGNRRDFYNFFNISFLGSSARKQPFALVMADIDHFKNINDKYGHKAGDKVLCHVADIFRTQCRETDKLYRWGGEEFLMLMPRTSTDEARQVLERMLKKLETTPYHNETEGDIAITSSFGLCAGNVWDNLDLQIAAADQNMYIAKREGRNRIIGPRHTGL